MSYLVKDVNRPFALEINSKWEYGSMTQHVGIQMMINDILDSKCLHFLHHQFHSVLMTNYDKLSKKESKHKNWHHSGIEFVAMSLSKHVRNFASIIQYPSNQIKHGHLDRVNKRSGKQRRPLRVFLFRHIAQCGCFRPAWENKQSLERKTSCAQTQVLPPHQAPSSALSRTNTQLIPNTSNVIIRSLSMCWSPFRSRRLSQQKTCLKFWFVNLI